MTPRESALQADRPGGAQACGGALSDQAIVGISGRRQGASAAVAVAGELRAFCEQERVTRVRRTPLEPGQLPNEAVSAILSSARVTPAQVHTYASTEDGIVLPPSIAHTRLGHHVAHAATAFFTSPFEEAVVLVCDHHSTPPVSVWRARGDELTAVPWPWEGTGFASLYSEFAACLGYGPGQENRVEALARLGCGREDRFAPFFQYEDGSLRVDERWNEFAVDEVRRGDSSVSTAALAADFQQLLGVRLLEFATDVKARVGDENVCLAGGLFYNTYFTTLIAESGVFQSTYVPPNPGNAGTAAGAALALSERRSSLPRNPVPLFLGPEYSDQEIKFILDNCKLTYSYVNENALIDATVAALQRGLLVGWFQGRMEWGHRALGSRSILASPLCPHVLENLNVFLKQREAFRPYGVSVCEEDRAELFAGPDRSRSMEFEYRPLNREPLRHVLHAGANRIRVQTIDPDAGLFRTLHKAVADRTGLGVLVNTSFNGFSEPIVCSPRDAVRVFFGTGIDLLVIGRFIIHK